MNKLLLLPIIFLMMISLISCGSKPIVRPEPAPEPIKPVKEPAEIEMLAEGWIGEDIYRAKSVGTPSEGITGAEEIRKSALEDAVNIAQRRIVEKFVTTRITGLSETDDIMSTGVAIQKEFGPAIRSGKIVQEIYKSDGSCIIMYEVELKNLKRRVSDAHFKEK